MPVWPYVFMGIVVFYGFLLRLNNKKQEVPVLGPYFSKNGLLYIS